MTSEMDAHLESEQHKRVFCINRRNLSFRCDFCDKSIAIHKMVNWETHLKTLDHKKNEKATGKFQKKVN